MGIYKKLLSIQSKVRGLKKNEEAGQGASGYKFVNGSKVLDVIRPLMDKEGLLLIPQVDSIENERIDYQTRNGGKSELLSKVMMTFTWVDAETGETLPVKFGANGMNNWDKGLGSALTYAERYFLLKFFHIATDEDDVDSLPPRGNEDPLPPKKRIKVGGQAWNSAVEKHARGENMRYAIEERYSMTDKDWEMFFQAVVDYKTNNNLR